MPDISSLASRVDAEFACATLEWQGKKFYFIGEETRRAEQDPRRVGRRLSVVSARRQHGAL
jgi:hypothetical protein